MVKHRRTRAHAPAATSWAHAAKAMLPWLQAGTLVLTIPAFYLDLLAAAPPGLAGAAYLLAAAFTLAVIRWPQSAQATGVKAKLMGLALVAGLLLAASLPHSASSAGALALRLIVAFLSLWQMIQQVQHRVTRGSVAYLLFLAFAVLALCGVGFWWLEPRATSLADGLWLAFTTAATVGYGDIVPTTAASKIFSVFVVLLGYGVLTLVTAAIATSWVETEERRIEREILHDMREQLGSVHAELAALRQSIASASNKGADDAPESPSAST